MADIDLRALGWSGNRPVTFRPIVPTKALENELYGIYADSISQWQALVPQLIEQYDRNALIDGLTTDADGAQLQWLIDQKSRQLDNTILYQTEKLGRWVSKVGTWHGAKTISAAKSATGVEIKPYIRLGDVRNLLDQSIRQNVALIKDLNADTKNRLEQVIFDGLTNRRTKKWLTDEIAKAMGITKRRARRIAGDQMHKLNSTLTRYRNEQMGIRRYIWRTMRDERVRRLHAQRENKIFRWDTAPSDGHPGWPINCRCSAAGILDD